MSRIKTIATAAVCGAAILIPTAANAADIRVQSLSGDFAASNSTVTKTPDGVHFGTYADAGAIGGSLTYHGMDGKKLSELTDFSYTFTYRQAGATTGAAPYARVFLDADPAVDTDGDGNFTNDADDDVILDPSFCATKTPEQSVDLTFQMVGNSVRFSDDGCDGVAPDNQPYQDVVALHGNESIVGLLKYLTCRPKIVKEVFPHSDSLAALSGKYVGCLHPYAESPRVSKGDTSNVIVTPLLTRGLMHST